MKASVALRPLSSRSCRSSLASWENSSPSEVRVRSAERVRGTEVSQPLDAGKSALQLLPLQTPRVGSLQPQQDSDTGFHSEQEVTVTDGRRLSAGASLVSITCKTREQNRTLYTM